MEEAKGFVGVIQNEQFKNVADSPGYVMHEVTLECGDLRDVTGWLFVKYNYNFAKEVYYKGFETVEDWHLFGLFPMPDSSKDQIVTLSEIVSESLVDDLIKEALS